MPLFQASSLFDIACLCFSPHLPLFLGHLHDLYGLHRFSAYLSFFSEMVASYFYLTPDVVLVVSLVVKNPKFVKKNAVCKIAVFTVGYLKKKRYKQRSCLNTVYREAIQCIG